MTRYHIFFDGIFEISADTPGDAKTAALDQLTSLSGLLMIDASKPARVVE
jgi:hypothetical protein